jgi:hypothetical protein
MKNFAALGLWFFMVSCGASAAPITIGIIGDQTIAPADADPYVMLKKGVEILAKLHPDVVIHTGDLLESLTSDWTAPISEDKYKERFQLATSILNGLKSNWYLSAGDHDVNPPYRQDWGAIRTLFMSLYPPASTHLYYSFDVQGYHFIALSSQDYPNKDARWGVIFDAHLSETQLEWLTRDLGKTTRTKGIVVFLHQPLWYQWADWAPVHRLLAAHHVTAVIAGHFHYNQDEGELDGIRYVVVGATGGGTNKGSPEAGDLHHVTLLTLNGKKIQSLRLLPLGGESVSAFSSRRDMDRVQALAVDLSNSGNDQATSAVKETADPAGGPNKVITSCNGGPPTLVLRSVGNSLDVPVAFSVTPLDGNLIPVKTTFHAKWCTSVTGKVCQLKPDALMGMSNNSTVEPDKYESEPLWTAEFPSKTSDGKPPSQRFTLKAQFDGSNGRPIYLESVFRLTSCPPAADRP